MSNCRRGGGAHRNRDSEEEKRPSRSVGRITIREQTARDCERAAAKRERNGLHFRPIDQTTSIGGHILFLLLKI